MAAVNLFVIISGVLFFGCLLGIVDYLVNHEENKCEMTYMFEYPQYVRIVLPSEVAQNYPRYKLYAYGEGKYTEKLRGMEFGGIPVLFIPGNSGSYKQVRSLASVSLRKSLALNSVIQFDYFTADLNEEYSALYGPALCEQTKFIHHCIGSILNLYSGAKKKPTSVILIGHSMGGLVAKGLLLEPGFDAKKINTIITLATPHRSPVLMVDEYMAQYYANVSRFWTNNRNGSLKHITLASIGGGHRDVLVRSELIKVDDADFSILTTAIPGVWVSADHLSILWCKQLVLTVVRALFDMVDSKVMQITESVQKKNDSLSYHLMKRTAGKRLMEAFHPKEAHFSEHGDWQEPLKRQYTFHKERVLKTTYIMVRLTDNPKYHMLAIEAVNLEAKDWVFACVAEHVLNGVRMCLKGVNLSNETKFLPSVRMKRKGILLNVAALRRMSYSHVIVQIPPLNEPVHVYTDVHSGSSRKLVYPVPRWLSFASGELPVLEASTEGALRYELRLQGADLLWQAYLLHLRPSCPLVSSHHATATMTTSWSHEDVHAFVTEKKVQPLHLKLQSPKPSKYGKNETMRIKIILDPACRYSVSIQSSLSDSLGQMVRFYAPMLLPYMVAVLILAVRQQMKVMENEGHCSSVHTALAVGAKPYYILPTVKIASKLIGLTLDRSILPPPDANVLQDKDLDFLLLPILVYTTAFALVYVLCIATWVLILFWGNAFHKIMTRIFSHFFRRGFINWGEWALSSILNFPKIASVLLIAIAMGTCGAIALLCGLCFYFLLICKFYEDILEEMLKYPLKIFHRMQNWASNKKTEAEEEGEDLFSRLYFHSTLFVMWLLLTILHFPCALVWVNNVTNNSSLRPDPSFPSAVIVCGCAGILWQKKVPNMKVKHFQVLMYGLYMLSCLVLVYASWSTYRTGVFIHMSFILVTVFQSILVEHSPPEDNLGLDEAIGDEEKEEKQVEDNTESLNKDKIDSPGEIESLDKDKIDSPGEINETSYLDKEKME